MIQIVKKGLSNWKVESLSIGYRLTLVKSVLGCLPLYHVSLFRAPLVVVRQIETLHNKFFRGFAEEGKKLIWAKISKFESLGVSFCEGFGRG